MITKICEQCGKKFEIESYRIEKGHGRFCSVACKGEWQSNHWLGENNPNWRGGKVTQICEVCKQEFEVKPCLIKKGRGRFCSNICRGKWQSEQRSGENSPTWQGGKVTQICEVCEQEFEVKPYKVKQGEGKFCSRACQGKWRSEYMVEENSSSWRGGKVTQVCEVCKQEFEVWPAWIRKGDGGKFCSKTCQGKWRSENFSGENSPTWQGGKSFEPYGLEFNNTLRRAIRKRDNYTCAISGEKGLDVHHINYDKTDNRQENLITLNRSSHTKTNYNRKFWEVVLSPIAIARTQRR